MVPLGESHTGMVNCRQVELYRVWLTLLQLELLDAGLIGSDGGTLDTNAILLDGLSRVDGDLVVCLVTVFETQVVVLEVNVEVTGLFLAI